MDCPNIFPFPLAFHLFLLLPFLRMKKNTECFSYRLYLMYSILVKDGLPRLTRRISFYKCQCVFVQHGITRPSQINHHVKVQFLRLVIVAYSIPPPCPVKITGKRIIQRGVEYVKRNYLHGPLWGSVPTKSLHYSSLKRTNGLSLVKTDL